MNAHVSPEFRMQTSFSRYDFGAQLKINVRNLSIISNCFEVAMTLAGDGKNAHFDWPSYFESGIKVYEAIDWPAISPSVL